MYEPPLRRSSSFVHSYSPSLITYAALLHTMESVYSMKHKLEGRLEHVVVTVRRSHRKMVGSLSSVHVSSQMMAWIVLWCSNMSCSCSSVTLYASVGLCSSILWTHYKYCMHVKRCVRCVVHVLFSPHIIRDQGWIPEGSVEVRQSISQWMVYTTQFSLNSNIYMCVCVFPNPVLMMFTRHGNYH